MTDPAPSQTPFVLLGFGPMIDMELSRLVLRHYGLPFVEERHLIGWSSVVSLFRAGSPVNPVLLGTDRGRRISLVSPRGIVEHFDDRQPEDRRLLPPREPRRRQVEADWQRFNGELAGYTAVVAYYHLLPQRDIMLEPFARGVAGLEGRLVGPAYPLLQRLLTLALGLNEGKVRDCLTLIRGIVAEVDARLSDGRAHLAGATVTLSELSLASALAPLVLPTGYGAPIPPYERMPAVLQGIVTEMRGHRTAGFIQRFYAERQPAPKAALVSAA